MPREITHWRILQDAASLAEASAPAAAAHIREHQPAALFGAVAPDALWFHWDHNLQAFAEEIHSRRSPRPLRILAPLVHQIMQQPEGDRSALWAFFLGMATHAVTDALFHPCIVFFSGNFYSVFPDERLDARARHHALEVYIDSWFAPTTPLPYSARVARLLSHLGPERRQIETLLDRAYRTLPEEPRSKNAPTATQWHTAFSLFGLAQRLFLSRPAGSAVRLLNRLSGRRLRLCDALFSLGRTNPGSAFFVPLHYVHPISGEQFSETLSQLAVRVAQAAAQNLAALEPLFTLTSPHEADEVLARAEQPLLATGLFSSQIDSSRHLSQTGLSLPGLEITL